jgi:hypothetical protein
MMDSKKNLSPTKSSPRAVVVLLLLLPRLHVKGTLTKILGLTVEEEVTDHMPTLTKTMAILPEMTRCPITFLRWILWTTT